MFKLAIIKLSTKTIKLRSKTMIGFMTTKDNNQNVGEDCTKRK
jgi:hypothetical protein